MNIKVIFKLNSEISESVATSLSHAFNAVLSSARTLLLEDIADPEKNSPSSSHHDMFMARANEFGIGLLGANAFHYAEMFYRDLLRTTLEYCETHNVTRHVGAFYANIAIACWAQGNVEKAVYELFRAADADKNTGGVNLEDTYAMRFLYPDFIADPTYTYIASLIMPMLIASNLSTAIDLKFRANLGDLDRPFLAAAYRAKTYLEQSLAFPNPYSRLQFFGAIGTLTVILETYLKILENTSQGEFYPLIEKTFGPKHKQKLWWKQFTKIKDKVTSGTPSDEQVIRNVLNIKQKNDITPFIKGLVLSWRVRNYTLHYWQKQPSVIDEYAEEILSYILFTLVTLHIYHARQ